jgi:hypothetical protein
MLVVPSYKAVYLLDPATGEILYENALPGVYAAAKVANGRLFIGDTTGVVHAYAYPSSPGAGSSTTASVARVRLAKGCRTVRRPAFAGVRVRVTRLGAARAPATIAVFKGTGCTGKPVARRRLRGGARSVLRVPKRMATGSRWSVLSSKAVRLKLALAR